MPEEYAASSHLCAYALDNACDLSLDATAVAAEAFAFVRATMPRRKKYLIMVYLGTKPEEVVLHHWHDRIVSVGTRDSQTKVKATASIHSIPTTRAIGNKPTPTKEGEEGNYFLDRLIF
ncbi:unnamed protein product [Colletotrichum noveboracense]|uniref:Uncharacterized protein n=1 Tax=Colletotrichum noveboracense TaxID=2664923 RepID=A0A9W4S3J6_9PEZI|nr:unnamed protein product [Colletotrichum noveboracense]